MRELLHNIIIFLNKFKIIRSFFKYLLLLDNPYFKYRLSHIIFSSISENEKKLLRSKIQKKYTAKFFNKMIKKENYDKLDNFKVEGHHKLEDLIKNNLDAYFIQIGSCTGREINFIKEKYPSLNCISTDMDKKFLDYQEKKYGNKLNYAVLNINDINNFLKTKNIIDKKKIIYVNGIFNYLSEAEVKNVISKFLKIKNTFYVFSHVILKSNSQKKIRRLDFFDHNYSELISQFPLKSVYEKNMKIKDLTFSHFGIYKN